jgi:hypothetical protein
MGKRRTIYTLALEGYAPDLIAVTFQLIRRYAQKIEAEFVVIDKKKFNRYPTYEKFQIWDLMKERDDEWSIFFDADTMVHPDFPDILTMLPKDTTCSGYSSDFTPLRFRPDTPFLRDGRYLGKGTWFIVCSEWTREIWHPIDESDITYEQCVENIFPTNDEIVKIKKTPESLIDDYVASRNIAKCGLKHTVLTELCPKFNCPMGVEIMQNTPQGQQKVVGPYLQHDYNRALDVKHVWTDQVLKTWGVTL